MQGSNGYSVFAFGVEAHGGEPDSVVVSTTNRTGGAFYWAPATVTDGSIQADLGSLGKLAVTYRSSGTTRTVRSKCGGRPVVFDAGVYEGEIVFHGELGYTDVEVDAAPGSIGFLLDVVCPDSVGGTGSFLPGAELKAKSKVGPRLWVIKNRPRARAHFEVSIEEKQAGIGIERFTSMFMPPSSFEYDPKVRTATVRPPAPFSGVAQFHRNAKPSGRWTGNLAVDLPGMEDVKLAGASFRASLAHAHWNWH